MHETVLSESRRLPWLGWSRPGRAFKTYRNCKEMFLQIHSEGTMGIESLTSFIRWVRSTMPMLKMVGWILCWTPSSSSQGLLEYKFCSNQCCFSQCLLYSYHWVLLSQWDEYHLSLQKWVAPVAWVTLLFLASVACFVSSRTPAWLSQVARCFQMLWTSSSRLGCCCCCCCVCQNLFNVTFGGGLRVARRSKSTRSPFWDVTRSMQSPGTCCAGDDCKWLSASIAILDPVLLTIFQKYTASWLRCQFVSWYCILRNGCVIKTTRFFFRVLSEMDSGLYRRLIDGPCHSLFPPGINPLAKMEGKFQEIPLW